MRKFDGGRRGRVVVQLAVTVLAALAFLYAGAELGLPGTALASILVLVAVLSLAYLLYSNARTRRQDGGSRPGALHDPLTGLSTRPLFVEKVEEALERSASGLGPAAILFVDLDDFKEVKPGLGVRSG